MVELQIINKILEEKSFQIVIFNNLDTSYFPNYYKEFSFIKKLLNFENLYAIRYGSNIVEEYSCRGGIV